MTIPSALNAEMLRGSTSEAVLIAVSARKAVSGVHFPGEGLREANLEETGVSDGLGSVQRPRAGMFW